MAIEHICPVDPLNRSERRLIWRVAG